MWRGITPDSAAFFPCFLSLLSTPLPLYWGGCAAMCSIARCICSRPAVRSGLNVQNVTMKTWDMSGSCNQLWDSPVKFVESVLEGISSYFQVSSLLLSVMILVSSQLIFLPSFNLHVPVYVRSKWQEMWSLWNPLGETRRYQWKSNSGGNQAHTRSWIGCSGWLWYEYLLPLCLMIATR